MATTHTNENEMKALAEDLSIAVGRAAASRFLRFLKSDGWTVGGMAPPSEDPTLRIDLVRADGAPGTAVALVRARKPLRVHVTTPTTDRWIEITAAQRLESPNRLA